MSKELHKFKLRYSTENVNGIGINIMVENNYNT